MQLLGLLVDAVLPLSLRLDLQVLNRQVDDLVSQTGLFHRVRWRREISCPLEPEEVLVVIVFTLRLFVLQVLEARQVKLTPQVELVSFDGASILAELIKSFDCPV